MNDGELRFCVRIHTHRFSYVVLAAVEKNLSAHILAMSLLLTTGLSLRIFLWEKAVKAIRQFQG